MAADSSMATSARKTTKTMTYKTDASGNVSREVHTHVDSSSDANSASMRKMEERIHILEEDLESEMHLRRRIESEKQGYQMQIIQLSERLTEAEGGAENQLDINRKREAEMAKLRKLLEDVHTESEQQIHILRKKHQEAMMELQEQIDIQSKSKEKVTKENSTMKVEISALMAQIEILSSEKISIRKVVEKLEININDYSAKCEELNKTVIQVSSDKQRLQQDAQDANRKFNEMKLAIETSGLDKNKLASNIKDLQDNIDALTRIKNSAETTIKNLDVKIKEITVKYEEEHHIRIELEKVLGKAKDETKDWKNKYENEVHVHSINLDDLKKNTGRTILGLEDAINQLTTKLKAAEQQKLKMSQETAILIKDFEHSQMIIKELNVKIISIEKKSEEIAIKLREMTNMYEKCDKDSKMRAQEVVKLANELDRSHMEGDGLRNAKAKLEDELKGYKVDLEALKKRLHEVEQENRKLAHDREELARAYKDTDAIKLKLEQRVQELDLELKKVSKSADVNLKNKEDEFAAIRKKMIVEIESLTTRLHQTEAQLKNEVEKIKKKMAVTITELEMSLDASNKNNGHLTMASKAQQQKIMELTSAMDKANMNLKGAGEQNMAFAGKIQMLEVDITKIRQVLEQTNNAKKVAEQKLGELAPKYTEMAGLNNTLVGAKTKLEKDLVAVRTEYTDIARELKLADERANKASHDAQHFEGLLREEANKLVKCENTKKALETEMRSLTIRMEEIETNTVATSRRTIQKMEIRIEELEILLSKEKQTHVETTTILHKKESSVKALLLQSEEDRKNIIILQESLDKLNEKIKMYKRQLEEQEQISNSNIMRVKKFQRELEASEARAEEAESSLNAFRSRARVFATAESKRETVVEEVERQVVVNKSSANVSSSRKNTTDVKIEGSSTAVAKQNITDVRIGGSSSALQSSAVEASSSRALRAGSTYSRAGSMARSSVLRAGSVGRAGSTFRY